MKPSKALLTVVLMCTLLSGIWAQKHSLDVIHLKNGSVLRGKILSETSQELELQMADQSVWVFPQADIVQQGQVAVRAAEHRENMGKKGFEVSAETGVLIGKSLFFDGWNRNNHAISTANYLHVFTGYRFSRGFSLGLETGADGFQEMTMLPFALTVRGDLLRKGFTPFYTVGLGHAAPFLSEREEQEFAGGRVFQIGGGLKKTIADGLQAKLSVAYRQQNISISAPSWGPWGQQGTRKDVYTFNRLALGFGLVF